MLQEQTVQKQMHLFKYAKADTCLNILTNGKLRYSSPLLFNDPFDCQTEHRFDFDISELPQLVQREIENILFSRKAVDLDKNEPWGNYY